jgi:hypothetical protein
MNNDELVREMELGNAIGVVCWTLFQALLVIILL